MSAIACYHHAHAATAELLEDAVVRDGFANHAVAVW